MYMSESKVQDENREIKEKNSCSDWQQQCGADRVCKIFAEGKQNI